MKQESKQINYIDRAKDELKKIRKALGLTITQRDNLNQNIVELEALEKNFVYLIEDVADEVGVSHKSGKRKFLKDYDEVDK